MKSTVILALLAMPTFNSSIIRIKVVYEVPAEEEKSHHTIETHSKKCNCLGESEMKCKISIVRSFMGVA